MGRFGRLLFHIVGGHTDDDIQRFGGPIGAKRRQKRLSSVIFHGFWPFSQRDAAQSLPRFSLRVVRLILPFFVVGIAAQGCVGGKIRAFRLNSPYFTQNPGGRY